MEIFVLGTSGMMPLPNRHLSSVMVRKDGRLFLFDCGEGTQVAMRKIELHWKKIERIFITHMHSDHLTGLPGLLMLSSQVDRTEPLHIYGPSALKKYISMNREILDMFINYEIIFHSIENADILFEDESITVRTFNLMHTKPCNGFSITEKERPGVFNKEMAESLKVPKGPLWGKLQRGEDVLLDDGRLIKSRDVVGEKRKGLKFSFVTDTLYFPQIKDYVMDSDLLICEGMFEGKLEETAHEKKHMTAVEAATLAKNSQSSSVGLIHYSPRYNDSELKYLLHDAKNVFEKSFLCRDGMNIFLSEKS